MHEFLNSSAWPMNSLTCQNYQILPCPPCVTSRATSLLDVGQNLHPQPTQRAQALGADVGSLRSCWVLWCCFHIQRMLKNRLLICSPLENPSGLRGFTRIIEDNYQWMKQNLAGITISEIPCAWHTLDQFETFPDPTLTMSALWSFMPKLFSS